MKTAVDNPMMNPSGSGEDSISRNKGQGKGKNNLAGEESYWAQDDWQGTGTESWNDG